jgi:hypothetical protein
MNILFASIVFIVLLLFLNQVMDKLHPIFVIIFFFIMMQAIVFQLLIPLFQQLQVVFQKVPYSKNLLWTAFLLLIGEMICGLLEQLEYEAFAELVKFAVRLVLVSYWLMLLQPAFQTIANLLERFLL